MILESILCLAILANSYTDSLEALAKSELVTDGKSFKFKKQKVKGASRGDERFEDIKYEFGTRAIVPLSRRAAIALKRGKDPLTDNARQAWVKRGCHPDTELILAQIQCKLDVCDGGDRFMGFLNSWRNGDESFYEALDRTAGTEESLFYYDAMLADFVNKFVGKDGKKWDLQTRQNNIANSFLTYRQYRGMIEAVAWTLVLPSDQALPPELARYDYDSVSPGMLSTRHIIDIYIHYMDYDVDAVIDLIGEVLRQQPLPDPLWSGTYSPISMLITRFNEDLDEIINTTNMHTTTIGQMSRDTRAEALKECIKGWVLER